MNTMPSGDGAGPVYRVDKFDVPVESLPEFLERVRRVQRLLGSLAGCGQNLVLTQTAGPARFNVVTVVEWASDRAMSDARSRMQALYRLEGFDPEAFLAAHQVQSDLGVYVPAGNP